MGMLPFYVEYIHKNPDFISERFPTIIKQWLDSEPTPSAEVRECLLGIDDIYGTKWSSAAHLQAHLQQNPLDLTDDKEYKITFYIWLLGGTLLIPCLPGSQPG
jgi:hypothetical protein